MQIELENMISPENAVEAFESDVFEEECANATSIFNQLDSKISHAKNHLQFPDIFDYSTGFDRIDSMIILSEKEEDKYFLSKIKQYSYFSAHKDLYQGHIRTDENVDIFFTEDNELTSSLILDENFYVRLVNVNDKDYNTLVSGWRFPQKNESIVFSRNIQLDHRDVKNVDVVLDRGNELYSSVTDSYLRKALIRNKNKDSIVSIIKTIQENQNEIRTLDKNISFIVQGCAGSGKTMVLLHRLNYLLFNNEIPSDAYILLFPSQSLKNYLANVAEKFSISKNNIFSYVDYYKYMSGRHNSSTEENENVFPSDYLAYVYSPSFIKECYSELISRTQAQLNTLIDDCDPLLNLIIEEEVNAQKASRVSKINKCYKTFSELFACILPHLKTVLEPNLKSLENICKEIRSLHTAHSKLLQSVTEPTEQIKIREDDERILNHSALIRFREEIHHEETALSNSSIFTKRAHKEKLDKLRAGYMRTRESIVKTLLEEERQKQIEELKQLSIVFDGVSFSDLTDSLSRAQHLYENLLLEIKIIDTKLVNIHNTVEEKYSSEIQNLNSLIDLSSSIDQVFESHLQGLTSCGTELISLFKHANAVRDSFSRFFMDHDSQTAFIERNSVFSAKTDLQIQSHFHQALLGICKKRIRTAYGYKISDCYKHYWYIYLYTKYLSYEKLMDTEQVPKYLFIDEAQDLSEAEYDLLCKINKWGKHGREIPPILNLFGDIQQSIYKHGIDDWGKLANIHHTYILNENFRNSNQIIEYCNEKLNLSMQKVGVDMEPISEHSDFSMSQLSSFVDSGKEYTFVVKNQLVLLDLEDLLIGNKVRNFKIYTVKEAKGLEFKEVYVIKRDMTVNEQYIAYTRALSKLHIIDSIPYTHNTFTSPIIEGED